ncbi:MAG: Crp/Fnr family transcriptional regulator [Bacteroidales bacterium]|nr:Crp/Fnr family transcriptional regulator [Bacteroidales bacterium]
MIETFFKQLNVYEKELKEEIKQHSFISTYKKGDYLIKTEEYIKVLKIVLKGKVRVFLETEDREILIYYISEMEACILSLSETFGDYLSTVNAIAEEDSTILNIPVRFIKDWAFKYKSWNDFTINTFRLNYNELMDRYVKLAFKPLKERLLEYLLEEANLQNHCTLQMSHQQIANEFGTTREVVSRLLKKLENEGLINLGQKSVQVIR